MTNKILMSLFHKITPPSFWAPITRWRRKWETKKQMSQPLPLLHTPCGRLVDQPWGHSSLSGGSSPVGLTGRSAPYCNSACTRKGRPSGCVSAGSSPARHIKDIRMKSGYLTHVEVWTCKKNTKNSHIEVSIFISEGSILLLWMKKKKINDWSCMQPCRKHVCTKVHVPLMWRSRGSADCCTPRSPGA